MRTALLGFTLDDRRMQAIIELDRVMPSQTHRFAWSLVDALDAAGEAPFLLSAAPVSSYPGYPEIVFRGGRFVVKGREGYELPFVNVVVLKHLTRFVAALTLGRHQLKVRSIDTLFVHGVHSPWLWFAAAMRRRGMTTVVVLTDPPGVVRPEDSAVVAWLKRVDRSVVAASLKRQSGVVVLAPALAEEWAPTLPSIVMEGVAPTPGEGTTAGAGPSDGPFRIAYAGGLSADYGAKALVEAVMMLPTSDVELRMFGKGPLEDWIAERSQSDPRICMPALVPPEEVAQQLDRANLLVQPRPVTMREARYSFPSKLLEYLVAGRPVVTTALPSLPPEYGEVAHVSHGDSAAALSDAIREVMSQSETQRREMGLAARSFATRRKSAEPQAERLRAFLVRTRQGR